tara:strand:+ start:278 stop:1090 length:813 start_codon:yes stop_codon:yes gene_type:complete
MLNKIRRKLKYRKSVSDNFTYPNFCLEASQDEKIFKTFRSNSIYQNILEHINFDIAIKYFSLLQSKYDLKDVEIYNKIEKLNKIGSPELVKVSKEIPKVSSTGLRYLFTGLEIKTFLEKNRLDSKKIVELGCGYGGQSIILGDLLEIEEYTYIDLKEVNELIKKFVSNFKINFSTEFKTLNSNSFGESDLFISNYSFSELPKNLQIKGINKVIKFSKSGFMIINSENFSKEYKFMTKEEYKNLFETYEITEEEPQTSSENLNYLYKFINI